MGILNWVSLFCLCADISIFVYVLLNLPVDEFIPPIHGYTRVAAAFVHLAVIDV